MGSDVREGEGLTWEDLYDWLPGFEDVGDARRRERLKREGYERMRARIDPLREQLEGIFSGDITAPGAAAARRRVAADYGTRGRGVLANAAQRGVIHSGQVASYMRDLTTRQGIAQEEATQSQNQRLIQAILNQWQSELGLSSQEQAWEQFWQGLSEEAKRSILDELFSGSSQAFGEEGGKAAFAALMAGA